MCLAANTLSHEWEEHQKTKGCILRHELQLRPDGAPSTGPETILRQGDLLDLDTLYLKVSS